MHGTIIKVRILYVVRYHVVSKGSRVLETVTTWHKILRESKPEEIMWLKSQKVQFCGTEFFDPGKEI